MTITIKHLDGPLAGEEQTFGDNVDAVVFGRDGEVAQVVYPAYYDVVGREHFELRRTGAGEYAVELYGRRYVEIGGAPAENGATVKSGSTFRLGGKDGPCFKVEIGASAKASLPVTAPQQHMPTLDERIRGYVGYVGGALAIALIGVVGYIIFLQYTLTDQIEIARAEAAAQAKEEFSKATLQTLEKAVYRVAKREGDAADSEATAWAFAPGKLATNAHVTEAIKGREGEFFLIAPNGDRIEIEGVISHPGYPAFKKYKATQGTTPWGEYTPLDLINEYDVGIIEIDPNIELPATLDFASEEELMALTPGTPVASMGFPVEGLAGSATATDAPATLQFGHISALKDVFMIRADPEDCLLIQHSVPVTGGASGSPLVTPNGKVIGIVNGGNTTVFKDKGEALNAKVRVPSAALINFAQRIDLLDHITDGSAEDELEEEKDYWDKAGEQFADYFDVAVEKFKALARSRYGVNEAKETLVGKGTLDPGSSGTSAHVKFAHTFQEEAKPGFVYGFIADSKSGEMIGVYVKKKGTSDVLKDAKDKRQTPERELAPTAWVTVTEPTTLEVTVWSHTPQKADYELYAYEWGAPKPGPSAETAP